MQVGAGTEPSHHAAGFCIRIPQQLLTPNYFSHHAPLEVDLHEVSVGEIGREVDFGQGEVAGEEDQGV